MYLAISCIILTAAIGISLARYNLKQLRETKEARRIARAAYKKIKNERLKKSLGL